MNQNPKDYHSFRISLSKQEIILVAPLNWGIGHAARCIPLIRKWKDEGHSIYLAANGESFYLLHNEFPMLPYIELPECNIHYSHSHSQVGAMMLQLPMLFISILKEHRLLRKVVKEHAISLIVSDNRFGLWHRHIKSIYITHQMMIKAPKSIRWTEPLLWLLHHWVISKYDECWIPDVADDYNLSGDLAHKYPLPHHAYFIGWLSRFPVPDAPIVNKHYQTICLLSGPEPHRTLLEENLINRFRDVNELTLIVRGKPSLQEERISFGNVDLISHLETTDMQAYILDTPTIICRSGYSTLMDLKALNKTATELIPTPGQTEQAYLAQWNDMLQKHL
jgi:predicted glycosyltransferase